MMQIKWRSLRLVFVGLMTWLLSACTSPPSSFYVLYAMDQLNAALPRAPLMRCLHLGVGPIEIPRYLQKPEIVLRMVNNELYLSEFHRWAEPLHVNVEFVISQNLRWLLGTRHIVKYPWTLDTRIDLRVKVSIIRFDTNDKGLSVLIAHWSIGNKNGNVDYLTNSANFQQLADPKNYHSIVEAMNRNLANLSEDISKDIRLLIRKRPEGRRYTCK